MLAPVPAPPTTTAAPTKAEFPGQNVQVVAPALAYSPA